MLISIVCLTYNQAPYLKEAISSIQKQTYSNWELILIDDASTDQTQTVISSIDWNLSNRFEKIVNVKNLGVSASFNKALSFAQGDWIIDFSGDDLMHPNRLMQQVKVAMGLPLQVGVIYSRTAQINHEGKDLGVIIPSDHSPPEGSVFINFIQRYFIFSGSMLIRKAVLEQLGGYNELLAYEDFDFWVRSSKVWQYAFIDEVLHYQRVHSGNYSKHFETSSEMSYSTLKVLGWIQSHCSNEEELNAFYKRFKLESRNALFAQPSLVQKKYAVWLQKQPNRIWFHLYAWFVFKPLWFRKLLRASLRVIRAFDRIVRNKRVA